MRLIPLAAVALGMLVALSPVGAQERDSDGLVTMTAHTAKPLRVAYRAGIEALMRTRYPIAMMSLDRELITAQEGPDGRPAQSMVRLQFEPRGDSTYVHVTAIVPDSAMRDICRSQTCLTRVLVIETMVSAQLDSALDRATPSGRTAADSLAEAKAFGYAPENPIRVGGSLEDGAINEHKYIESLRGPGGEAVTYLRLGSCCAFETAKSPNGHGLLDAYEVTYPGLAKPITLYIDMYTPAPPSQGVPAGFVRGAAPAP